MDQLSPRASNPGPSRVDTLFGGTSLRNLTRRKLICCPTMSVLGALQDPRQTLTVESLGALNLKTVSISEETVYYLPVLRQGEAGGSFTSNCFMVTANPAETTQRIDESSPGYSTFKATLDEAEQTPNTQFSLFLFHEVALWMAKHPSSYRCLRNIILLSSPYLFGKVQVDDQGEAPYVYSHLVYYPSIQFE